MNIECYVLLVVEGSEKLENRLVSSFPVQDLIDGYVIYIQSDHENKEPAQDHFQFHATDGRNKSPVRTLNISILVSLPSALKALQDFKYSYLVLLLHFQFY